MILYLQVLTIKLDQQIEQNDLLSRVVCLAPFSFYIIRVNIYPVYFAFVLLLLLYFNIQKINNSTRMVLEAELKIFFFFLQ